MRAEALRVTGEPRSLSRPATVCAVLAALLLLLQGCSTAMSNVGARPGIYTVAERSDTPGWMGEPVGIPVWSPDGGELAWASEKGLRVASLASGESRWLTDDPVVGRPAWSPDGGVIAFIDQQKEALVVAESTTGAIRLKVPIASKSSNRQADDLLTIGGPAWSPDGARLAYICWDGDGDELCLIGADGTGERTVTKLDPPAGVAGALANSNAALPAWSPDGAKLAVAAFPERRGAPAGVFVVDLERGTSLRVSKLLPNSEIRWAPDGQSILFSATEKGRSDVWRVTLSSLQGVNLTKNLPAGGRSPALSPDGRSFAATSEGEIVVVGEVDDGRRIGVAGLKVRDPAWSPAGEEIAFAAVDDPIQSYD